MTIASILNDKGRNVVTIAADKTVGDAAGILSRHRIGAVLVVDEAGTLVGILSERDIVRAVAETGAAAMNEHIESRMTREVETCTPSTPIPDLMGLMTERKFRHVPVLDGGALAGMVSIGDIVKHRLAEMEAEHQAMRDYIAAA